MTATAESVPCAPGFAEVRATLEKGVEDGVFPGAVLLVGVKGTPVFSHAAGKRSVRAAREGDAPRAMTEDTVFDIAGLTTVVGTTSLVMRLIESGHVRLTDKVANLIQGFGVHHKSAITVEHLLSHCSGLAHWHPFFEELIKENAGARMGIMTSRGARDYVINAINRSSLKYEIGSKQLYSDIGFILLGHLAEVLTGLTLDRAVSRYVFGPLGMKSTSYIDLAMIRRRGIHPVTDIIAPTEECPWRQRIMWGEVHDDNAWAMGGVAGHSGLFSVASDLHRFGAFMLRAARGQSELLTPDTVQAFWRGNASIEQASWRYGWDSPSRENGMNECGLSSEAVGFNSFTGCSLWLDPRGDVDIVLLTNRIHPSRSNKRITAWRPQLHRVVLDALQKQ